MADKVAAGLINRLNMSAGSIDGGTNDWISNLKKEYDKSLDKVLDTVSSSFDSNAQTIVGRLPNMSNKEEINDKASELIKMLKNGYGGLDSFRFEAQRAAVQDIKNIVAQFPELDTAISIICNALSESDEASGTLQMIPSIPEINNISTASMIDNLDATYSVKHMLKDVIIPATVQFGNAYCYMVPYSKILSYVARVKANISDGKPVTDFSESVVSQHMKNRNNKGSRDAQLKSLFESATRILSESETGIKTTPDDIDATTDAMLSGITVSKDYVSTMIESFGVDGLEEYIRLSNVANASTNMFEDYEAEYDRLNIISNVSDDYKKDGDSNAYNFTEFKGVYIKWIDSTQIVPCRIGDKVLGYFYVDREANPMSPKNVNQLNRPTYSGGRVDISAMTTLGQNRAFVNDIANLLISSIDKPFLKQNIRFMDDIIDIIMAQDFTKHTVKMTFIPADDIIPFRINEDADGSGRSAISKSLYRARLYTMMMMSEILTILNNRPSRVYKVKRDPLNNDIGRVINGVKAWLYSRRITPDDTINYGSGITKIGSGEDMVVAVNQAGETPITKEFEEGYQGNLHTELLDMLKKDAINATHVPAVMIDNASNVEFAKSLELANTEFVSFIKKTKSEISVYISNFLRTLISYAYNIPLVTLKNFSVSLPDPRQQDLIVSNDMINNFEHLRDMLFAIYYRDDEIKEDGKLNAKGRRFAKDIAKRCMPQIPYDVYDELVDEVGAAAVGDEIADRLKEASLLKSTEQDIGEDDLEK